MMKNLLLLFFVVAMTVVETSAQSLKAFKRQLTAPKSDAYVEIYEMPEAAAAFDALSDGAESKQFNGWRINLFFSNGQRAREEAQEVVKSFEEAFPGLSVDMVYDNPYFKVSAGRCATAEEAIILLERIRVKFPKAFLMREAMTAVDLLGEDPDAAPLRDSLSEGSVVLPIDNSAVSRQEL